MANDFKKRLKRTAVLSLVALVIGSGIGVYQIANRNSVVVEKAGRPAAMAGGQQVGGSFTLTDHNGKAISSEDFSGQYKLIYFGFTSCPAICPTELQKITAVMKELPVQTAEKIQPLFITVDPERDTAEVLKNYVSLFHPRLIGLTGSQEEIDTVLAAYHVYASKVQEEGMSDYTMDHSSFIYLTDPDNKLITLYRIQDTVVHMTRDIQARVAAAH